MQRMMGPPAPMPQMGPNPPRGGQALSQYQALMEAMKASNRAQVDLEPLQQQWDNANSVRSRGLIPGLIEMAYDAYKRKKLEPEYKETLKRALDASSGADEIQRRIELLEEEERDMRELAQKRAEFDYEEGVKHENRMKRDAARGADRVYNITPPTGYTFADPKNPEAGYKVIPGSPQERDIKEAEEKDAQRETTVSNRADSVLTEIDKAISLVGPTTAGWGGMLKDLPASDARALQNVIKPIQANLAFDRLQAMRNESKTGGALGQVSNIELELLKSTVGSLDQLNKPEELTRILEKIREHYAAFTASLDGKVPANYLSGEINGKKYVKIGDQWHEL